jgi:Xaa-Pro aminopeptidase
MRRGLISWSKTELPVVTLNGRMARAQAAMAKAGIDAMAVYSNPARTAGVSWFTTFLPYWNHCVLVLPASGAHVLVGGFSHRVNDWMKRTSHLDNIIHSPKLGSESGRIIAEHKAGSIVAIPDLDTVPTSVVEGITAAGATVVDGTALLAQLRAAGDPASTALYFTAAHIAHASLKNATASETDGATVAALIDGIARRYGAEEVYVGVCKNVAKSRTFVRLEGTCALADTFALRLTLAYKGTWVRLTRTLSRDPKMQTAISAATQEFAAGIVKLPDVSGITFKSWLAEGCRTTQPLEALAGSMVGEPLDITPGMVVSLQATIETPIGMVLTGAPALVGRDGEATALLVSPDFGG